jgi:hypothetical protein
MKSVEIWQNKGKNSWNLAIHEESLDKWKEQITLFPTINQLGILETTSDMHM